MPNVPIILGPNGSPLAPRRSPRPAPVPIRGRYDAATLSDETARHWANADALSARAANSPQVRWRLRNRARYEVANNGYASGIVKTLANDTIGTGPRLQLMTKNSDANARASEAFEEWTAAVCLAEKLRTMRMAKTTDGEGFGLLFTNPRLATPVKLDIRLVEADQIATPYQFLPTQFAVDGIQFDDRGNPTFYHVLKEHPGDLIHWGEFGGFDLLPAEFVLHWFNVDRPGQLRGVPEIMAALPLFAQLRRYTLATLSAAEIAAMFAALLKSTLPPDPDDTDAAGIAPFDSQEIVRGMMTALPDGYDVAQLKAEQPTTTYPAFKNELLNEIARPLNMPFGVAAGNSKDYNYSSGRLDHQVYHRAIGVDRYTIETHTLDRIFAMWLVEAREVWPEAVAGLDSGMRSLPRHRWGWDGFKHVDPEKEANAQGLRMRNGTTTMDMECAEDGNDWREIARQQAEERAFYEDLGIPYPGDAVAPSPATPPPSKPKPSPGAEARMNGNGRAHIHAKAPEPSALRLESAAVEIQAAAGESKRPTFSIMGYTGAPMNLGGFYSPVIVDLAGLKAASQEIPALRDHDTGLIVGQTDSVKIDAKGAAFTGVITGDNADAREVVSQSKNGFKWQASIGASVDRREFVEAGKTATVNGRELAGPLVIAREATIYEISFVAIGADGATSANVAASNPTGTLNGEHDMSFEAWLQAKGFDPAAISDTQRTSLRAMFDAEQKPTPAPAPTPTPTPTPAPAEGPTLESIMAETRKENERVAEITRLTAAAVAQRPGAVDTFDRLARAAIDGKSTVQQFQIAILTVRAETASGAFSVHTGDLRTTTGAIEAAICKAGSLNDLEKHFDARTLQLSHERFPRGIGLVETITIAAREHGYSGNGHRDLERLIRAAFPRLDIRAEGFSTLSLPGILSNVANKFLAAGFNAVEDTWRTIASRRAVNDFKQATTYSLTGGFMYEKVGAGGELKHATAGELSYTNQAETYGRLFAITRKDLINDDLGALTAVPKRLGRGAALKLNDVFWTVFLNNSSFFSSGNVNLDSGAGTALSLTSLTAGEAKFRNQTDPDGFPVGVQPAILLVPNAISTLANNLVTSTMIANDTTANTVSLANNPFAGRYKVATSSYMSNSSYTGYSTTAWYLLANPDDLPVIEAAFLDGRETPVVESADAEFDTLGIQFRGYLDMGVSLQEYRGGYKSAGA